MVKKSQWKCVFLLHQTLSFLTVFFFHAIDLFLTLLYRKVWQHGSSACCWGLQYVGSRTDLTPFFFKQPSAQEFKEVGLSQCLRGRSWLHCCECVPSLWVLYFVNSSWPHLKDPALVVIFTERLSMAQSPIQGQKWRSFNATAARMVFPHFRSDGGAHLLKIFQFLLIALRMKAKLHMTWEGLWVWSLAACQPRFTQLTQILSSLDSGAPTRSLWLTWLPSAAGPVCLLSWDGMPLLPFSSFSLILISWVTSSITLSGNLSLSFSGSNLFIFSWSMHLFSSMYHKHTLVEPLLYDDHCTIKEFEKRNKNWHPNAYHSFHFTYLGIDFCFLL